MSYTLLNKIGRGAYGVVFKAKSIENNEIVAIKQINLKPDSKSQLEVFREISALQNSAHLNIVRLIDVVFSNSTVTLIMEYAESNLKLVIEDIKKPLNDQLPKFYFRQILYGIAYLHHIDIMHRDLKPENILINSQNQIKIADFGLACLYHPNEPNRKYDHQVATRWYRAPELLFGSTNYDFKVDIWALGCVMVEFFNGIPLFAGTNDIEQIGRVFHVFGTPTDSNWPEWEKLPDSGKVVFDVIPPIEDWHEIVDLESWCTKIEITKCMELIRSALCLNPKNRKNAKQLLLLDFLSLNVPKSIDYKAPTMENSRNICEKILIYNENLWADSFGLKNNQIFS